MKIWIQAARLRTLPLSFSSIIAGNVFAFAQGSFSLSIFLLTLLTTLFLQVLSNYANDYGDSIHGADLAKSGRKGPQRAVSSGALTPSQMKNGVMLMAFLSFITGISLLYFSFNAYPIYFYSFLGFGLASIAAAILYTNGKKPYGYAGFGDIAVFLFFGLLGVIGSYFLQTKFLTWNIWVLGASQGFLATAVLNVNNLRDINSDLIAGKMSIPVRLGLEKAKKYHAFLVLAGYFLFMFSLATILGLYAFLCLPTFFPFGKHLNAIMEAEDEQDLDKQLKPLSLSILMCSLLMGLITYFIYR